MKTAQERFQELQKRSQTIIQSAIQINTKIETARENYEKMAKLAKEKYGTDDLDELEALKNSWEEENKKILNDFEIEVKKIEEEVNEKTLKIKEIQQDAQSN